MCFLSLRERHVSSQFDDFSQRIHPSFTNVHRLIASRSLCSLCALILPRQTPFHFHWLCVPFRFLAILVSSRSSLPRFLSLPRDPRFLAIFRILSLPSTRGSDPLSDPCPRSPYLPASSRLTLIALLPRALPASSQSALIALPAPATNTTCFLRDTTCFLDPLHALDEMLAAAHLASFESSNSPTLPTSPVFFLSLPLFDPRSFLAFAVSTRGSDLYTWL